MWYSGKLVASSRGAWRPISSLQRGRGYKKHSPASAAPRSLGLASALLGSAIGPPERGRSPPPSSALTLETSVSRGFASSDRTSWIQLQIAESADLTSMRFSSVSRRRETAAYSLRASSRRCFSVWRRCAGCRPCSACSDRKRCAGRSNHDKLGSPRIAVRAAAFSALLMTGWIPAKKEP
jgi:hypothetical protein